MFERWEEFHAWADEVDPSRYEPADLTVLGPPSPRPRQVFAIGLNYRDHIAETGQAAPESPSVFTKFATSLTGPNTVLVLPTGNGDWEVELVAIIGKRAENVAGADAIFTGTPAGAGMARTPPRYLRPGRSSARSRASAPSARTWSPRAEPWAGPAGIPGGPADEQSIH